MDISIAGTISDCRKPPGVLLQLHRDVTRLGCNPGMFLQRTDKAQQELLPGQRQLSLREHSLLLLAENMPLAQLEQMYHGQGQLLVQRLLAAGYLALPRSPNTAASSTNLHHVRMHMLDLCERLLAERWHDTAQRLRQQLRKARDAEGMLHAREQFLQAVQLHAGIDSARRLARQLEDLLAERSLETV